MTIQELHSQGLSNRAIARELGLGKVTIDRQLKALGLKSNFKANRKVEPLESRFWRNVSKRGDCWEWQGGCNKGGYGIIDVETRTTLAHRLALELTGVTVPADSMVLHSCDNPPCVRPKHLSVGTHQDNTNDMVVKGRQRGVKGAQHHKAKLSDEQVKMIRFSYALGGVTQKQLAYQYGVSQPMIGYIVRGERWTHI